MCGRYVLKRKDLEAFLARLGIAHPAEFVSRYNIAPTTVVPAIRAPRAGSAREAAALRWGLVPAWSRDLSGAARLANARAEGIAGRPAFRDAFRRRRCVIPASGFYEWQTAGRLKLPRYFERRDAQPLALAGLWEHWRGPDGLDVETCSLITTAANPVVGRLHDRMPVILPDDAALDRWLDPAVREPAALEPLLVPLPGELMQATPVSPKVNSVRHDGPDLLDPVPPPAPAAPPPVAATDQLSLGLD